MYLFKKDSKKIKRIYKIAPGTFYMAIMMSSSVDYLNLKTEIKMRGLMQICATYFRENFIKS